MDSHERFFMNSFVRKLEALFSEKHLQFWAANCINIQAHVALVRYGGISEREPVWFAGNGELPDFKWGVQFTNGRMITAVLWTTPDRVQNNDHVVGNMARILRSLTLLVDPNAHREPATQWPRA